MNIFVAIEKDDYHNGVFIFKFPFNPDYKEAVYSMIGRLYVEMGEDKTTSYSVKLTEKNILEVKIRSDGEDREQQEIQEVLNHWHESRCLHTFVVHPLNFDLVLTSSPWDYQDKRLIPHEHLVKAGHEIKYDAYNLKWKYQV